MKDERKVLSERLPVYVLFRIERDIGQASRCWESIGKAGVFDAQKAGDIAFELCHFIADFVELKEKMKSNIEKRLDRELEDMGVQTRTYHLKEMWPFAGVTIVTADREGSFRAVKEMVQKAISMHTLNKATKTKKDLNDLGIFGVAICDVRDQYSKKRGRIIAKGRLLKELKRQK